VPRLGPTIANLVLLADGDLAAIGRPANIHGRSEIYLAFAQVKFVLRLRQKAAQSASRLR
jgi:hypothetical protein